MSDWQYKWCNEAMDGNDFFCIYNKADVKQYFNYTTKFSSKNDNLKIPESDIPPNTHFVFSINAWLEHEIGWETDWKLVRFWDHIYQFHIPKFAMGFKFDTVFHLSTDKGKSLDPAICLQPAVFI